MDEQTVLDIAFTYDYETYKKFYFYNLGISNPLFLIIMIPSVFTVILLGVYLWPYPVLFLFLF